MTAGAGGGKGRIQKAKKAMPGYMKGGKVMKGYPCGGKVKKFSCGGLVRRGYGAARGGSK